MENGLQKGCKKIMVLYKSSKKGSKPDKSNWVMHQYHLGTEENEKEGEFVVSKIFYQQQKQTENNDGNLAVEDSDIMTLRTSPRTPKANPPNPPRPGISVQSDDVGENNDLSSLQVCGNFFNIFLCEAVNIHPGVNYWWYLSYEQGDIRKRTCCRNKRKEKQDVLTVYEINF